MPELPEVEVVRAGVAPAVSGRTVARVRVLHDRPVRSHPRGREGFAADLAGRTMLEPRRRGKFLWIPFTDGDALVVHFGMSGQFRVDAPGAPVLAHTRVVFEFADGGPQLRFVDQRMFGGLQLAHGGAELPDQVAHIAKDPFDPAFDVADVVRRLITKRTAIKRALLDQRLLSGIGNIYADESLWRARIHFEQPASSLTPALAAKLLAAAHDVMAEALRQGGTSFDSLYVNVNGSSGYFDRSLNVYGRQGEPCPRCATPIARAHFMNRSSFFCPVCQPTGHGGPRHRNDTGTATMLMAHEWARPPKIEHGSTHE